MNKNNLRFTLLGILGCVLVITSLVLLIKADTMQDGVCAVTAFILSIAVTMASILSLKK